MLDRPRRQVTFRLTWLRLRRSPAAWSAAAAFPTFILFLWIKESYGTALRSFLFLLPHAFLFLSQDMIGDEVREGRLENVLFLGNGFKDHLFGKNAVLVLSGIVYGFGLFIPLWVTGLVTHRSGWGDLSGLAVALLAGVYYVMLGGLLSHYLKGGSNVLALIVVQAAAFMGLLFSAAHRGGFLDLLGAGNFPGFVAKLEFLAFAAILPNVVVAGRLRSYALWTAGLAVLVLFVQWIKVRRLELKRP
jgi:hypothetical protein